jgi:hypothetical protein
MFEESMTAVDSAGVSDAVKQTQQRNHIYRLALVAIARGSLDLGRELALDYRREVSQFEDPFEVQRQFELSGEIALADNEPATALTRLALADQSNPRILLLEARAHLANGNSAEARAAAQSIVAFNQPRMDFAIYWRQARKLLDQLPAE